MSDRFSIEGLRYVNTVAQTASFSAAARSYGVTQPALSNGVAKLEEQLGSKLFDRTSRGVTPTAFGTQILPLVERALDHIDAISAEARRLTSAETRSIHVGVSPLINPQLIARTYAAVRQLPEPRDLVLREANMKELLEGLSRGELDIILIPAVQKLTLFDHLIIDSEPVVVVDSRTVTSSPVELDDTAGDPLILVPDACGLTTFTEHLFASHKLEMSTYSGEALSYQVLEQWANLGLGTAILPLSKLSSPEAPHRPLLDQGAPVRISYEIAWHRKSHPHLDIALLVDMLSTKD